MVISDTDTSVVEQNNFQRYINQVSRFPLLKPEQEKKLARRVKQGDKEAREKFINANLRLVINIAKSFMGHGLSQLDLIQEGNLGLIRAADRFDVERGNKFSTYATWWIRQAMSRAIFDKADNIRIPVHMRELLRQYYKVIDKLLFELRRNPTPDEIAKEMDIPLKKALTLQNLYKLQTIPLDRKIRQNDGSDENEIADIVSEKQSLYETSSLSTEAMANQGLKAEKINEVLATLTPREQRVMILRYGLNGEKGHTLEEVGQEFNVTRERIRQIQANALRKLRQYKRRKEPQKVRDLSD